MHVNRTPRIAFVTLGCAKNEVDTDKMQARLAATGFSIVDDVDDADLVIVNTCAFLASAVEEGLEVIFDLVGRENAAGRELKVLVAGCSRRATATTSPPSLSRPRAFLRRTMRTTSSRKSRDCSTATCRSCAPTDP